MNNPLSLKLHKLFSDLGYSSDSILEELENLMANDGSEGELADSAIALDWLQIRIRTLRNIGFVEFLFGA